MTSVISLKKASAGDIKFLWQLRNQADIYRYSRNPNTVAWPEHIKWAVPVISGLANKSLYVIRFKGARAGQIRFDFDELDTQTVEISISIYKKFHGQGIGTKALKRGISILKRKAKIKQLIAEAHKDNAASIRLFEKLDFKLKSKKNVWRLYIKRI